MTFHLRDRHNPEQSLGQALIIFLFYFLIVIPEGYEHNHFRQSPALCGNCDTIHKDYEKIVIAGERNSIEGKALNLNKLVDREPKH